MVIDGKQTLTC